MVKKKVRLNKKYMTYYENQREQRKIYNTVKTDTEKSLEIAKEAGFPKCKGLYPDCPEKPDKENSICRTCPILEEMEED